MPIRRARSAARVADYIDLLLSESDAADEGQPGPAGSPRSIRRSTERFKAPFAKPTPAQQVELLTDMSRNELARRRRSRSSSRRPRTRPSAATTPRRSGIHKELHYQGNQFLPRVRRLHASRARLRARRQVARRRQSDRAERSMQDQHLRRSAGHGAAPRSRRRHASRPRPSSPARPPRTSSSSARAPPAAWPPSSSRPPASRCCCSRPVA